MDRLLTAPEPLMHSVLVALCDDDRVQARALGYLAELQNYAAQLAAAGSPPPTDPNAGGRDAGGRSRKRKRPAAEPDQLGMQLCVQCKHAFTPSDNSSKACFYHDGVLEILEDHALWADWDAGLGRPHDSPENQEDHPEGFAWSCCDKDGTRPGCTKGYHVAVRKNHFKRFHMHPPHEADPGMSRVFEGRVLKANEFVNESLSPNRSVGVRRSVGHNSSDVTERDSLASPGSSESELDEDVNVT